MFNPLISYLHLSVFKHVQVDYVTLTQKNLNGPYMVCTCNRLNRARTSKDVWLIWFDINKTVLLFSLKHFPFNKIVSYYKVSHSFLLTFNTCIYVYFVSKHAHTCWLVFLVYVPAFKVQYICINDPFDREFSNLVHP